MNVHPLIDGRFAISVSYLAAALARQMGLPAVEQGQIALAGKLLEIGLTGLAPALLQKTWYQLDAKEWLRYREHVRFAAEICRRLRRWRGWQKRLAVNMSILMVMVIHQENMPSKSPLAAGCWRWRVIIKGLNPRHGYWG